MLKIEMINIALFITLLIKLKITLYFYSNPTFKD